MRARITSPPRSYVNLRLCCRGWNRLGGEGCLSEIPQTYQLTIAVFVIFPFCFASKKRDEQRMPSPALSASVPPDSSFRLSHPSFVVLYPSFRHCQLPFSLLKKREVQNNWLTKSSGWDELIDAAFSQNFIVDMNLTIPSSIRPFDKSSSPLEIQLFVLFFFLTLTLHISF